MSIEINSAANNYQANIQIRPLGNRSESSADFKDSQSSPELSCFRYHRGALQDIDGIRGGEGVSFFDRLFGGTPDSKVRRATEPNESDNCEAKGVRADYRRTFNEARRERARAGREVEKLGPGHHQLSNGDQVDVTVDCQTGQRTVRTQGPDGSTKTVTFNVNDSNSVSVNKRNADGSSESLRQHGTTVSKSSTDAWGERHSDRYHLNRDGRPSHESFGNDDDDYSQTTANSDGSSERQRIIYRDEDGRPVYDDQHTKSWEPSWFEPTRPFSPGRHPWSCLQNREAVLA